MIGRVTRTLGRGMCASCLNGDSSDGRGYRPCSRPVKPRPIIRGTRLVAGEDAMAELLVVGGERVGSASGTTTDVIEPATGSSMAQVAEAGPEDARRAVDTALAALEDGPWPRTNATSRGRVLLRAAALIRDRLDDLATLEARNGGKPIGAARGE